MCFCTFGSWLRSIAWKQVCRSSSSERSRKASMTPLFCSWAIFSTLLPSRWRFCPFAVMKTSTRSQRRLNRPRARPRRSVIPPSCATVPSTASADIARRAAGEFAEHAGERPALGVIGHPRRIAAVLRRGREAERAVIHRLADQLLHRRELFRRCLDALGRGLAQHIAADAGMAHQRADIDAAALAERVQVIADRFPGYIDAGLQ